MDPIDRRHHEWQNALYGYKTRPASPALALGFALLAPWIIGMLAEVAL